MSQLTAEAFSSLLLEFGFDRFYGVPDSTLEPFMAHLARVCNPVIMANEAHAVAMAAGFYAATGRSGSVFLQNSGLGNIINPLSSLAHPSVFQVPMLLIIGWRGYPGATDEPQHAAMGKMTPELLKLIEVPSETIDTICPGDQLARIRQTLHGSSRPFAILVPPSAFAKEPSVKAVAQSPRTSGMSRYAALTALIKGLPRDLAFVATTGKTSRELFILREREGLVSYCDLRIVGSMGCASSVGLGLATASPDKTFVVLDGDGAALMHLGALATIGQLCPPNLLHILFANGCHDSTGGQPTAQPKADFARIALAMGYPFAKEVLTQEELVGEAKAALARRQLTLIVARIVPGSLKGLGRPTESPQQNLELFMREIRSR